MANNQENMNNPEQTTEEFAFKKSDSTISPIRTYKSDYSETIKNKNIGQVDIVAAEMRRGYGSNTEENSEFGPKKKINFIIPILIFLALGVLGYLGYLFFSLKTPGTAPKQLAQIPPPLIFSEKQENIVLKDANKNELSGEIKRALQKPFSRNNIVYLPILKDEATKETYVTLKSFLEISRLNLPTDLAQSLDDSYMLGMYSKNEKYPILILKIKLYENAFSGIIRWESKMASDLAGIWPIKNTTNLAGFKDKIISNHDVRELDDTNGNLVLIYSFLDRNTLIISTNEEAIKAVFERFTFR